MNVLDSGNTTQGLEAAVEEALASPRALRFPPNLERKYILETIQQRFQGYLLLGWIAIFLFDLFTVADYIMLPDIYPLAWGVRLGIATPVMIAVMLLARLRLFRRYIANVLTLLGFLAGACLLSFMVISSSPHVQHYYAGVVMIIMFAAIVVRLPFWHTFILCWALFGLYLLVLPLIRHMPDEVLLNIGFIMFSTNLLVLLGNYRMEQELRREYLRSLKMQIDAEKLDELNSQLEALAISDPLTGLFNRRHFDAHFSSEWRIAVREHLSLALIFLDIDFFKRYNDHYGHQAGDQCLLKIAMAITENVHRPGDACARYGGEEFLVLLANTNMEQAVYVAGKIRDYIKGLHIPHAASDAEAYVTVSMGISQMMPTLDNSPDELLAMADRALYRAKKEGRNRICQAAA
ncbi:MAG: diguanylate cyclase [Thermodesulfobacteriota bacterium]|nr:diguanylate cyclase [Thermodesulfobacteriota bacterium]